MIPTRRSRPEWILAVVLLAAPVAAAQQQDPEPRDKDAQTLQQDDADKPVFVLQVPPELLDNGLNRLVEQRLAKDYGLDDYQQEEMRQVLQAHVPAFLKEHQQELQGLLSEWLVAISADTPPDPEYAANWAKRFLPIVEDFKGMVDGVSTDMRGFLDDRQQVLLDGYLAAINVGTTAVSDRLHEFEAGYFNPDEHWLGNKHARDRGPVDGAKIMAEMENVRRTAMAESTHAPGNGAAATSTPEGIGLAGDTKPAVKVTKETPREKDEWERYVESFIQRYKLNSEQQQKARGFLKQQADRRDSYCGSKASKFEQVKRMFKNAEGDPQKKALAESALQRLYTPIDRMFEQLKERLDTLPTRAQRKAAAEAEQKESKKPDPTRAQLNGKK